MTGFLNTLLAAWTAYAVDIAIVIVMLVFALIAAKRGFVDCLLGFVSTLVAILIAFLLMKSLVRWTNGLFGLQGVIDNACVSALSKIKGFDIDISSAGIAETLSGKLPAFVIDIVVENIGNAEVPKGTTVAMTVADTLSGFAVTLIAWLLLFFIVKLLLRLLDRFLSSLVEKLPIVGAVNTLLGLAVGALQGLLIVSGVLAVLALFPSENIASFFNQTLLAGALYNHNPIHTVFGWFLK